MSKKSNFILGVIKSLSYLGCLMIILANSGNNLLVDNNELIKPVIYIESLILRFMVITTILTYAGFNLMREVLLVTKNGVLILYFIDASDASAVVPSLTPLHEYVYKQSLLLRHIVFSEF